MTARGRQRQELVGALKTHGLIFVPCRIARRFIQGGWRNRQEQIQWTVNDILKHFHWKYDIEIMEID